MNTNLILVKCITLLYLEALESKGDLSSVLCKDVIDTLNIEDQNAEVHDNGNIILYLRTYIYWLIENGSKGPFNKRQFLQRLRVAVRDQEFIYESVGLVITDLTDEEEIEKTILTLKSELKEHVNNFNIKKLIKRGYGSIMNNKGEDLFKMVRELHNEIEPYTHSVIDETHHSIVDSVTFDKPDLILELLGRSQDEISSAGVLKTGYQAINRMLGSSGGFRRGEFVLLGALQHQFKTGFTLNLFKHFALYNDPYMRDPKKKPLLVHFSLENELPMNIMWLYVNLKENATGERCDVTNVDLQEATNYITTEMGKRGYHIAMLRIEPNSVGVYDLIDMLLKYISEGYEIHAVVCDYLNMANRTGVDRSGPSGTEIRSMMRITRNFCAPRGITFLTPHQLSTEAKALFRDEIPDFVQFVAGKGYYDGSKQIDQEVDVELIIHIEERKSGSYLTVQRGKHRKLEITDKKYLYVVLPFHPVGGVLDDINGVDRSLKTVGGKRNASEELETTSNKTEDESEWFS